MIRYRLMRTAKRCPNPVSRLRRELLLHLKDRGGLKYREIAKLPDFAGVKMNFLGSLYRHQKSKTS